MREETGRPGAARALLLVVLCAAGTAALASLARGRADVGAATTFDVFPPNPSVGQPVRFRDTTTPPASTWNWDFGDGTRATEPSPTKIFPTARQYNVTLFTNSGGASTRGIIVSPENILRFHAESGFAASGFDVTLAAMDQRTGRTGEGRALGRSREFGYFSIPALTGNPDNPEVFVKVLDARTVNGEYWVFYGGLTDLEYTLTVRHNPTGRVKAFFKQGGSACGGFDTSGFSRTPTPTACAAVPTPLPTPPPAAGTPVFSVPMIDLSKVTEVNPFGAVSLGGQLHPALELRTEDRTLDVSAVTAGTVVNRFFNPNEGDFEMHTRAAGSPYLVIYDHIRDPLVDIGSIVSPGTLLGKIGYRGSTQGRVEIQVNREPGSPVLAFCPTFFGTPEFRRAHEEALARTGSCAPLCSVATATP
ncbi:MAG: PKD domain-containing protein [Thermoanaerobaculia bacterium]